MEHPAHLAPWAAECGLSFPSVFGTLRSHLALTTIYPELSFPTGPRTNRTARGSSFIMAQREMSSTEIMCVCVVVL
jgi:hypothetical protein